MNFGCKDFFLLDRLYPLVIAEIGVNHNGDPELAMKMADTAIAAGANIVKFQAFRSSKEISRHADCARYQCSNLENQCGQLELCSSLELSFENLRQLKNYCHKKKFPCLFAAFETDSLHFLVQDLGVKTIKIPSGEVTNHPLLKDVGQTGVAVILSTGASTLWEVGQAIDTLINSGCPDLLLFHCVSEYPTPPDQVNLHAMKTMAQAFNLPVGFSDHTTGPAAAIAAAALGAVAIEKHFTLDCNLPGPDHKASIEPGELSCLVQDVRRAGMALGDGVKRPQPCEEPNRPLIRKGLVAASDLKAGTRLELSMIEVKRPEVGIQPADLEKILGRTILRAIDMDEPIRWNDLS